MDAQATIVISLLAIGISALVVIRLNRADEISDEIAYGDYPAIPREMATVRKPRGEEAASDSGRLQQDVTARRHVGFPTQ